MRRVLLVFAVSIVLFFAGLPALLDRALNRVAGTPAPAPSARAQALFATLRVADLHADPLLWQRDLVAAALARSGGSAAARVGQRRVAGLRRRDADRRSARTSSATRADAPDQITLLAVLQRWPRATWTSRLARALHQAREARRAGGGLARPLVVVRTAADLRALPRRARAPRPRARRGAARHRGRAGARRHGSRISIVLFGAGIRMIGLAHFFDNAFAGSSAGVAQHGLTPLGRELVPRMEALGVAVDLAHVSPASIDDVLALATEPVVVSHGGLQSVCPGPRNLTDAQSRGIAATGGVIGIGYFEGTACGTVTGPHRALDPRRDAIWSASSTWRSAPISTAPSRPPSTPPRLDAIVDGAARRGLHARTRSAR